MMAGWRETLTDIVLVVMMVVVMVELTGFQKVYLLVVLMAVKMEFEMVH